MTKPTKGEIEEARHLIPTRPINEPEPLRVGLAASYATELHADPSRVRRAAALMLDDRWPRRFSNWQVHAESAAAGRRGKLPVDALGQITGALEDYGTVWVDLKTRGPDFDHVYVDAGRNRDLHRDYTCPFRVEASIKIVKLPDPNAVVRTWVTLAHDLASTVGARNGTITVGPSSDVMLDQGGPYLPDPEDHLRIIGGGISSSERRPLLGGKYARYPRWGTYLHPEHVAAIGGRDRLKREVDPAVLEPVDDLLYIQLTDNFEDAHTPAMWEKRLKLRTLMEPILVT